MCEECHQNPCHPQCPNADEPKIKFFCELCDAAIYEDECCYDINEMIICEDCVEKMKRRA